MNSRIHDLLICRSRHARFPARIAQFDAVAARIEDEELPPGEEPARTIVFRLANLDAEMVKELARFSKHVRADVEGMVQPAVLLHGSNEGILTLAKKNIVIAELEAGHRRISQPPDMFQSQNLSIEPFRLFQIVHRYRPVDHGIELQHSHILFPFEIALPHSLEPVHK